MITLHNMLDMMLSLMHHRGFWIILILGCLLLWWVDSHDRDEWADEKRRPDYDLYNDGE